jgi:hypothetical protein
MSIAATKPARAERARWLEAELNRVHFRGMRLLSLKLVAAASLPFWIDAYAPFLPDLPKWMLSLVLAYCVLQALSYAVLEHVEARQAAQSSPAASRVRIHTTWNRLDDVRSGLWYSLAIVCVAPWTAPALATRLPIALPCAALLLCAVLAAIGQAPRSRG